MNYTIGDEMKKVTLSLIVMSVFVYLIISNAIDIDFIIKCSIILSSLVIHIQGHVLMRWATKKVKFEKLKQVIVNCGGTIANLIIYFIFKEINYVFNMPYSGYVVVINFSLVVVNLLPIYPFDCFNVLTTLLRIKVKEDIVIKISEAASFLAIIIIFMIGIIQMIFFSYNCSIIITCLFISKYKRYMINEVEYIS